MYEKNHFRGSIENSQPEKEIRLTSYMPLVISNSFFIEIDFTQPEK